MGNHNHTTFEVLKILFEHIQRNNIKIVSRFIQHKEIRIAHQDSAQIQAAAFAPTQFIDIAVLGLGSEQEMLQKLRSGQLFPISQLYDFGNILYHVNHFHLLVKLESVLRVITETNRFTNIHRTAIRLYLSHQYFDESRFAGSVVSHNPHLLITGKDIGEIIQNL